MIGRRLKDGDDVFEPGDYGRVGPDLVWHGRPPRGHVGSFINHHVQQHEDGTITVSPSIKVTSHDDGGLPQTWHGYLEQGVWREVQ